MWSRGGENKNTQERKKNIYTNLPHGAGRFSFLIYEIVHIRLSTRYTNIQCKYYRGIIKQHQIEEEKSQKKRCLGGDRKNCATKRYHTKHFPPFNHLSTFSPSLSLSLLHISPYSLSTGEPYARRDRRSVYSERPHQTNVFSVHSRLSVDSFVVAISTKKKKHCLPNTSPTSVVWKLWQYGRLDFESVFIRTGYQKATTTTMNIVIFLVFSFSWAGSS